MQLLFGKFRRDWLSLIITSLLIGSVLIIIISTAADMYFGDTLSGAIGEYGEYDFILHIRDDLKDAASEQIRDILDVKYPGSEVKEGIEITGKANYFISLPESLKNKETVEGFANSFVNVPGYSGYTVMIEPCISIAGVNAEAIGHIMDKIDSIDGVRFSFFHHGSLDVITDTLEDIPVVRQKIESLIGKYKVIDIRLPIGEGLQDPEATTTALLDELEADLSTEKIYLLNGSTSGEGIEELSRTLNEMKRFLGYYATKVEISIGEGSELAVGESILIPVAGRAEASAEDGLRGIAPDDNDLIVRITGVEGRKATGMILSGDIEGETAVSGAFRLAGESMGEYVGEASIFSERKRLERSIDNGIALLDQMLGLSSDLENASARAIGMLSMYDRTVYDLTQVSSALDSLNSESGADLSDHNIRESLGEIDRLVGKATSAVGTLTSSLSSFTRTADNIAGILGQIDAIGRYFNGGSEELPLPDDENLKGQLIYLESIFKGLNIDASSTSSSLSGFGETTSKVGRELQRWSDKMKGYNDSLKGINNLVSGTVKTGRVIGDMKVVTEIALSSLRELNIEGVRKDLTSILEELRGIQGLDVGSISSQLTDIKASLPKLEDEEISKSISLIDSYIGGEVVPGERIELLVESSLNLDKAEDLIKSSLKGHDVTIFDTSIGVLQPGIRGEIHRILGEVRATIAALLAVVVTVITMSLDHTVIISSMRMVMRRSQGKRAGYAANIFGAMTGSLILTILFIATGAKIPFVNIGHIILLGFIIGYLISWKSERINPINIDEFIAGEAMGMEDSMIMRNIVIPSSRPGILYLMNLRRRIIG